MDDALVPDDPEAVAEALRRRGWLTEDDRVRSVGRAGEGNMNLVLRVRWRDARGAEHSAILKQARPWVEKYTEIPAPPDRLLVEADFYRAVAASDPALAAGMPALRAVDEEARLAWLEDLGEAADYLPCYGSQALPQTELDALLRWLGALHRIRLDAATWPRLRNRAMRALNHAHLFAIPLDPEQAPDVDAACPGLQAVAEGYRQDGALRTAMELLGARYLEDGSTLLHGDFYPGSWLRTAAGPRVIDPEFGFLGCPEFDVGVLRAHLDFAGAADRSLDAYAPPVGFDPVLAEGFAGVERIRRLLGVAQLPLEADLAQRRAWLEQGRAAVLAAAA
jgi:5-methylthioribose kinase